MSIPIQFRLDSALRATDLLEGKVERLTARIAELEAENARLREVLKPFAEYGRVLLGQKVRAESVLIELWGHKITVGNLRAAATLNKETEGSDGSV